MRIASVVGARPQFIKLAPLSRAFSVWSRENPGALEYVSIHTGQHYDTRMSDIFFKDLQIEDRIVQLNVGSGWHGRQTGEMLRKIEECFFDLRPDAAIVYGDTNSTLAGALAAAKMHVPLIHIEAGLRSFKRDMPEEINRVLTDHASDLLCAPTSKAVENLEREGLLERTYLSGDVMYDAILMFSEIARGIEPPKTSREDYALVTLHRAENTQPEILARLLEALGRVSDEIVPVVFPVHPRTRAVIRESLSSWSPGGNLTLIEPLGYLEMIRMTGDARVVLTDSGGLQKEAAFLGTPCVTLRNETEWVETVVIGANRIAGTETDGIVQETQSALEIEKNSWVSSLVECYGDGNAAVRIRDRVIELAA